MIGVSLCPCQALGTVDFFLFLFSLSSLFCLSFAWSNWCQMSTSQTPAQAVAGKAAARKLSPRKHVKMGVPRAWDGMECSLQRSIHLFSLLLWPSFPYLGCSIIAGHHRISAGRWARGSKGP